MSEHAHSALPQSDAPSFRFAIAEDIPLIAALDQFGNSPTRDIHRDMEKYFGSVDPSLHERTEILLIEVGGQVAGKAELMLAPQGLEGARLVGYIKRVVVDPAFRGRGLARLLMRHLIAYARAEKQLHELDLHVWEGNTAALKLYEELGFQIQHRELYLKLPL